MADYPADITATDEWSALAEHFGEISDLHLRDLFADDPGPGRRAHRRPAADLYVDYCKHLVTDETLALLIALAERAGLPERIAAMFAGEHINTSEDRAVLHTALRLPARRRAHRRRPGRGRRRARRARPDGARSPTRVRSGRVDAGTPASGSAPSSTSASAAPTSAR